MRCVVAPDSFKGSLRASEVAAAIARGIRRALLNADVIEFPLADGGEGTLDLIAARERCEVATLEVPGADGRLVPARYGLLRDARGATAVLESAAVVGATLPWTKPVLARSTYGIGVLIRALQTRGIERFIVALGGTATNDGGSGMLSALGMRFFDATGCALAPVPGNLADIERVDCSNLNLPRELLGLADVDNVLSGASGATRMFGPQKGVANSDIEPLDRALARYGELCDRARHISARERPGTGAAGGLGYAISLLGGQLVNGADWLLARYNFRELLVGTDWLITGEGHSDAQTLHGKAPWRVAKLAKQAGVQTLLLSGALEASAHTALKAAFDACRALGEAGDPAAMREAAQRLEAEAARWAQETGNIVSR